MIRIRSSLLSANPLHFPRVRPHAPLHPFFSFLLKGPSIRATVFLYTRRTHPPLPLHKVRLMNSIGLSIPLCICVIDTTQIRHPPARSKQNHPEETADRQASPVPPLSPQSCVSLYQCHLVFPSIIIIIIVILFTLWFIR